MYTYISNTTGNKNGLSWYILDIIDGTADTVYSLYIISFCHWISDHSLLYKCLDRRFSVTIRSTTRFLKLLHRRTLPDTALGAGVGLPSLVLDLTTWERHFILYCGRVLLKTRNLQRNTTFNYSSTYITVNIKYNASELFSAHPPYWILTAQSQCLVSKVMSRFDAYLVGKTCEATLQDDFGLRCSASIHEQLCSTHCRDLNPNK